MVTASWTDNAGDIRRPADDESKSSPTAAAFVGHAAGADRAVIHHRRAAHAIRKCPRK
jgi:hypothetical protein